MKATKLFPYLLVLALIALLAGCGQEERPGEGAPAPQKEEAAPAEASATADQTQSAPLPASGSGLRVLQFLPDGQTSKLTQIVAMFNQPMVALGDYGSADQSLMVLDPPLPGRLRWLNQYCLAFVPDEPLFGSLSLSVTLRAGLASLSGDVLADERRISLSLPPVEVINSYRNTYVPDPTPLRPALTVFFNQSPDMSSLKAKGFFEGQDGAGRPFRVPIEAETDEDEDGDPPSGFREVRIRPAEDLPRDTPYSLVVEAGLVSLAGPEPTALPLTVFSDRTYGPLEVSLYGPEDDNGILALKSPDDYLSIEFNNPVSLSEALAKIESDPPFPALDELKKRVLGPKAGGAAGQAPSPESPPDGQPADDGPQASGQPEEATDQDDMGWDHADGLRTSISFYRANLKSRAGYSFTIKAGLKDVYGQVLEEDQVVSFRTGSYLPSVTIDLRSAILETGTRSVIPVEAVNMPSFRVLGYALSQDQARELIVLSKTDLGNGYAYDYKAGLDFLSRNASPASQEFRPPDGAVDGPVRMGLDLESLFGQDRLGHFLVLTVPEEKDPSFSMFQISDLGLTVKIGRTTGLAWTTDLASGRGLGGVSLEIVTPSGQSLWQGQSGPDGLAWLPGGQELARIASGLDHGDGPISDSLFIVAKDQKQMTLWNLAWNEGFEPYVMNLDRYPQSPFGPNPDLGFVLASQPVYRPGEKVGLKLIAREVNGEEVADLPPGPAKAVIANDDGLVAEIPVEIGPLGTGSLEFQLPDNARLGSYYVLLAKDPSTDVKGEPYVFSIPGLVHYGNFQVENFRAPAFGIAYEDLPKETVSGQKVQVAAQALYHFGGPVANRPAEYSFSSQDLLDFSLPTLPGYSMVNAMSVLDDEGTEDDDYEPVVGILLSGQGTLDSQGRLLFALDLEPAARPRPRRLTVHLGAQDVDSRSVYTAADILAHPASVYPALKTREFLGQAGQPLALDFAAASPDGTLVKSQVDITLFQRSWSTVRRRTSGGFYDYSSRASDKVVREISVTSSPDGPSSVELVPPRAGFYWVKASLKDDQGRANESSVSFYVHGDGPVGWLPSRDEGLTLIPDREAYAPGDTARILVQSPFSEAQALVTVERSGVREASLVDVQGQTPILEIPIGPDDGPNLFVSVILSRGRIAEEPDDDNVDLGKPATRKGYLSLRIPSKADILSVDVQTDAEIYAPGDEVRVNIRVAGQDGAEAGESEIALAVVDATLVQLLGDGGYFPDRIFSSDRPLSVLTVNPISILMGRRNLALKGGVDAGGGALALAEARARARADDPRSDFRNLAFFEPRVPVSPDGTAHVSFSLPDNLTTFKIYAVATGHGRLSGTGQKDFLVTKDVLLRPSLPAYSSLGDDFVAAATVTNRSDKPGQAKVSLSADNVEMVDAFSEKEVSLAPGQSLEVGFQVKASVLGTAGFTFSVDMDGKTDSARYEIPVVPVNALVTQASYRQLSPGLTPIDLALPEGLDQHRGGLSLELSPSLVGLLAGPLAFLRDYPHACMEQLTSKALGHLISIRLRERLGLSPEEVAQAEARVREHIALVASSNKEGGYDPWPGTFGWEGRSPVVSAYVLEFLLEARDADFDVPSGLIGDAIGYLSSVIGDPKANSRDWYGPEAIDSMTAYAAMVLARSGEPVSSFLEVLFLRRETLPLADLVNLIRGLGYLPPSASRSQMLRDAISLLQNSLSLAPGQAHFSEVPRSPWIWADNDKLTAMALLALCQTAPHNEFIPQLVRDLVSRASRGSFSSTQSNVHALLALSSYLALAEPEDPNLSISATLGDKELLSAVFRSPLSPPARATEPISALPGAKTLDISSEGTGEAWATVRLSFAPLAPDLSADNPSSLSISRSYSILRPEASSPGLSSFKRGQVVQVTVTLMTPEDRHDLVLEDRIPAGFETINLRFLSEDQTLVPGTDPESTGWKYTDSFWFDHQEIWPDRVSVYADFLPAGVYTFSYLVRPVTLGTYQVPGPRAEEMYSPEVYGRGPGQTLSVVPADSN